MTGRELRTVLGIVLLGLDVAIVGAEHVWRGRPLTILAVVFYIVVLAAAIALVNLETAVVLMRGARRLVPWGKGNGNGHSIGHTMAGIRMPDELPPPPRPREKS